MARLLMCVLSAMGLFFGLAFVVFFVFDMPDMTGWQWAGLATIAGMLVWKLDDWRYKDG